jgi:hypothetical protein
MKVVKWGIRDKSGHDTFCDPDGRCFDSFSEASLAAKRMGATTVVCVKLMLTWDGEPLDSEVELLSA